MKASLSCTKVAWIRNQHATFGQRAKGKLNCACRNAPESDFNAGQGNVRCNCGRLYTWDGYALAPDGTALAPIKIY